MLRRIAPHPIFHRKEALLDEQVDIQVSNVTKKEFTQAGSEMIRGLVGPAFLAVAVVTIVIMMFLGDYSLKAFLPPFVIVGALLLLAWMMVGRGYKDFPKDITFSYLIDVEGWQLTVGEESANIDWQDTTKLVVRSQVVLLYNEDNRSNMLPRRCLTDHQLEQMREWFQISRPAYRLRQRERAQAWRDEHRQKREQSRNGRRGGWLR